MRAIQVFVGDIFLALYICRTRQFTQSKRWIKYAGDVLVYVRARNHLDWTTQRTKWFLDHDEHLIVGFDETFLRPLTFSSLLLSLMIPLEIQILRGIKMN